MTWRVAYEYREVWLDELSPTESHTLDFKVIRDWIMEQVNTLEDRSP